MIVLLFIHIKIKTIDLLIINHPFVIHKNLALINIDIFKVQFLHTDFKRKIRIEFERPNGKINYIKK